MTDGGQLFLVLEHPFADLRSFIGDESGRLTRPAFPLAQPGEDFVRSSGLVKRRLRGGVEEWAGEEIFSDAANALRFPNRLGNLTFGAGAVKGRILYALRRFHSDGTAARYEAGFRLDVGESGAGATATGWLSFVRDVMDITVQVRDAEAQKKKSALLDAGPVLAEHYLAATSDRKKHPSAERWWFCSGSPALILEYPKLSPMTLPPHSRHVLDIPEADAALSHAWLQFGNRNRSCSAWFLSVGRADPDAVRRLRIHLTRLHAERECLRLVLFHIEDHDKLSLARNSGRSDYVQRYLTDALRAVQKPNRFGLAQHALYNAARQALGIAFEGQTTSLKLMRRQVAQRVELYIRQAQNTATVINNIEGNVMNTNINLGNVTVTGDFTLVTAANIENAFNKATSSDSPDIEGKLKALIVEVANLTKRLTPQVAENVSRDLNTFTSEATSTSPRKEWYELSAKGIIEAAKTIAEMAVPVTTAVRAVLALLAP